MPTHDWTRVEAGIFHHFHHEWISAISGALNGGLLPPDHYALAEQIASGFGPDVLTLQGPSSESGTAFANETEPHGGIALAEIEPKVSFSVTAEDVYAKKANQVVVHQVSNHRVVAVVEIVSPGNKSSPLVLASYVAGAPRRAFVEPVAVGKSLPKMPLFLTPGMYIEVPLESTYEAAWDAVPVYWQNVLSRPQKT
jgi:hypothetical protein